MGRANRERWPWSNYRPSTKENGRAGGRRRRGKDLCRRRRRAPGRYPRGPAHGHASLIAGAVVALTPGGVADHLVSLGDLPETTRGVGVTRVGIGVGVVGQAPVSTGDLILAGARQHLQPEVKPVTISVSFGYHYLSCTLQIYAVNGYHNTCSPAPNGNGPGGSSYF